MTIERSFMDTDDTVLDKIYLCDLYHADEKYATDFYNQWLEETLPLLESDLVDEWYYEDIEPSCHWYVRYMCGEWESVWVKA